MRSVIRVVVTILSLVLAAAAGAQAQEPASRDERELGGHRFIPSGRLPDPFVTTHARFRRAWSTSTARIAIAPSARKWVRPSTGPDRPATRK